MNSMPSRITVSSPLSGRIVAKSPNASMNERVIGFPLCITVTVLSASIPIVFKRV